jgi:hypothetical protein
MRRVLAAVLLVLGFLLTVGSGLAGWLNREVLDGPAFAANVDQLRRDPEVAAAVGAEVADAAVEAAPDLVAIKPLIGDVTAGVVASQAAEPVFRLAANQVHGVLLSGDDDELVLRLADVGAVVTALLRTYSDEAAAAIPPTLPVTLATVGGEGGPVGAFVRTAHVARTLAWLLPVLAVASLVAGGLVHPQRRRGFVLAGLATAAGGAVLVLIALAGGAVSRLADESTLTGAVTSGAWEAFGQPLFTVAALTLLLGVLMAAIATSALPRVELDRAVGGARQWLLGRPASTAGAVIRAMVLLLLGLALVFWTAEAAQVLAVLVGALAVVAAVLEFDRIAEHPEPAGAPADPGSRWRRRRLLAVLPAVLGLLLVVALLGRNAVPATEAVPAALPEGPIACNGHVELCDRPFDEVVYAAAHNAMSAEDADFYLAEQPTGMVGLLDLGVRALLVDTWYGQPTESGDAITAGFQFADARAQAEEVFGPEVMQSVDRLVASVQANGGPPSGPVQPFLCHTFCEIGGTALQPGLDGVRAWLQAHPTEVVTIFIQDTVTPEDTAAAFEQAGLLPFVHTPAGVTAPWPTLGEMVASGQRLVVLMENQGGGTQYPWLLQGFDYVQDTGYTFPTAEDFTCTPNRGSPDSPLFLVNHWLSGFTSLYTDAQQVNAREVLGPRVTACREERGRTPNLVAVNWVDVGDLAAVVDEANGLSGT